MNVVPGSQQRTTDCGTDVIFVLDDSGSIGSTNFTLAKSFLSRLVAMLNISSGRTRVGLVKYSTAVNARIYLSSYSSVSSLQAAISALTYTGGGTKTDMALADVRTRMLTSATGDRSNAANVVVVLTDGNSASHNSTQVSTPVLVYYGSNKHVCVFTAVKWNVMSGKLILLFMSSRQTSRTRC